MYWRPLGTTYQSKIRPDSRLKFTESSDCIQQEFSGSFRKCPESSRLKLKGICCMCVLCVSCVIVLILFNTYHFNSNKGLVGGACLCCCCKPNRQVTCSLGWHYLSKATCLIRPRLFHVHFLKCSESSDYEDTSGGAFPGSSSEQRSQSTWAAPPGRDLSMFI